jgi:formylglycine-generating enzyme required for sulfatase activity
MNPEHWQRICAVFGEAVRHPPAERRAFLDRACAADAALRAEVEGLLDQDVRAEQARFLAPPPPDPARAPLRDRMLGRRVGPYEIRERIGDGGMGSVYRAVRVDDYRQEVALKLLRHGLDSDEALGRFRAERQVLAELQHPHIARLLDGGTTEEGLPYLVMELVEGWPINRYCDARQLPTTPRLGLLRTVCLAVHHAHRQGVIHRDLKPGNVLLTAEGTPKIVDFGLAKRFTEERTQAEPAAPPTGLGRPASTCPLPPALTQSGAVVGTPSYMAPEQAQGKARQTGPRTDVYSLGAVLYELLTGRPPFRGETQLETLLQVVNDDPVPPRRLQPRLPRDVETICLTCLQKDPGRRYASALDLADDLGRFLAGEPVRARPAGLGERGLKWARRRPAVTAAAGLGLVAALAVAVLGLAYDRHLQQARAEAAVQALVAADTATAPRLIEELAPHRRRADPLLARLAREAPPDSRPRLHAALALVAEDPGQVDYLVGRLLACRPDELAVIRAALAGRVRAARFWAVVDDPEADRDRRLRAACALAAYDPGSPRWAQAGRAAVDQLLTEDPLAVAHWVEALRPVREVLREPLRRAFVQRRGSEEGVVAAGTLAEYADDDPAFLVELVRAAAPPQIGPLARKLHAHGARAVTLLTKVLDERTPPMLAGRPADAPETDPEAPKDDLARLHARAALALLAMGRAEPVWPLLAHGPEPRVRTYLLNQVAVAGVDVRVLLRRLDHEEDAGVRQALLLGLGDYRRGALSPAERERLLARVLATYEHDPDPGVHSAAEWLARHWGEGKRLQAARARLGSRGPDPRAPRGGRRWYVNGQGQTLAVVPGPVEFLMGSPRYEFYRGEERQHRRRIDRTFALGTRDVTAEEYARFREVQGHRWRPEPGCPINFISWYDAVRYCRWLSEQEGIPEDQMCYPPLDQIKEGMRPYPDRLARTGYRLPTEAEWECACRAGTITRYSFGSDVELLPRYSWHVVNARDRMWPAGLLRPNALGLFDVHGNVNEWCDGPYRPYPVLSPDREADDEDTGGAPSDREGRVVRSGGFPSAPFGVRSAHRSGQPPSVRGGDSGFRVARTLATPALAVSRGGQAPVWRATFRVRGPGTAFAVRDVQGDIEVSPPAGTAPALLTVTGAEPAARPFSFRVAAAGGGEAIHVAGGPGAAGLRLWPAPASGVARPGLALGLVGEQVLPRAEHRIVGTGPFVIKDVAGGVEVAPRQGRAPAVVRVTAPDRRPRPYSFVVERPGGGDLCRAAGLLFAADWDVKLYAWQPQRPGEERPLADWKRVVAGPPLETWKVSRLDFGWGRGRPSPKIPADYFALVADTEAELPAGDYELWLECDDHARVSVDGTPVLSYWPGDVYRHRARVSLRGGRHRFHVDYFEIDSEAELRLDIRPAGSAGRGPRPADRKPPSARPRLPRRADGGGRTR